MPKIQTQMRIRDVAFAGLCESGSFLVCLIHHA